MDYERVHVHDEIVLKRATTHEACQEFWDRYGRHWGALHIYGDASGARSQTTGLSDYQVIREFFGRVGRRDVEMKVLRSNPSVKERVELVNAKLQALIPKV